VCVVYVVSVVVNCDLGDGQRRGECPSPAYQTKPTSISLRLTSARCFKLRYKANISLNAWITTVDYCRLLARQPRQVRHVNFRRFALSVRPAAPSTRVVIIAPFECNTISRHRLTPEELEPAVHIGYLQAEQHSRQRRQALR